MTSAVRVHAIEIKNKPLTEGRPAHWANEQGTTFKNPWSSWRNHDWRDQLYIVFKHPIAMPSQSSSANLASVIPVHKPTWKHEGNDSQKLKATWLGHASFFVELPARRSEKDDSLTANIPSRGARILFDPIFSDYCAPIKLPSLKRITPPACSVDGLPEVDAVVISHDHYDHLDGPTITKLAASSRKPHFFAPKGNQEILKYFGVPESNCHILDWWQSRRVEVLVPVKDEPSQTVPVLFDLTCTPNQHNTGRNFMDRFRHPDTLWSSWVAREVLSEPDSASAKTVFFAGDTGYRAVLDGQDEDTVPVCEAFKQIGEHFRPIDLAMIPVGAYMPRKFMSPVHCSPKDSALLFKDLKATNGLGMHWGTFVLTTEPVMDPPMKLKEACEELGIEDGTFVCTDLGQTRLY
ncbi:Metallo-hydrolase/oxidoreductase [Rhodocollybia butyracea]|uniref:Metallo-hydrolase/oxidoreductase n=1 Tax=Rhodocollybia butyracea TaxID=206335 RepID=A0A9P5UGK4_9AGAR|nr:Metallo-hydrolase/oxidoreductase [Rhodocollybia butyracea]